ncbi:MAG TPA: AraC family transcriptional regulator, partial [Polyangia bacterium]
SEHLAAARSPGPGQPYLSLGLCFAPEQVARALLALSEAGAASDGAGEVPAFVMPSDPVILGALRRLVATLDDPVDRKVLAPLVVDEILYRLLRSPSAAAVRSGFARSDDAVRILASMRHIRERHADKLSVESLARQAAMSPSHFAHRFAAVARTTPMKFLREVRLDRARTLLLSNGTRAGEVAACVGFESAAHFTREFKRRYGVPPSTYLRPKSRA